MTDLLLKEQVYAIIGAAIEVHGRIKGARPAFQQGAIANPKLSESNRPAGWLAHQFRQFGQARMETFDPLTKIFPCSFVSFVDKEENEP